MDISFFGASHEKEVGVLIEGVPAGLELCAEDFAGDIARRAAGAPGTTPRREVDEPHFVSGGSFRRREECRPGMESSEGAVFVTDGTPLGISFENRDIDDSAYAAFGSTPRPGHADWVALKTCLSVPPGGGRASGRMTLPMVAAGVVAKKLLPGIDFDARLVELGGSPHPALWPALLDSAIEEGDSLGGIVECVIAGRATAAGTSASRPQGDTSSFAGTQGDTSSFAGTQGDTSASRPQGDTSSFAGLQGDTPAVHGGLPIGLGGDFFDSVESRISEAMFAIPGVRVVEFVDGFGAAAMKGSQHNDPIGPYGPTKNGSGGINGGRTNGAPIVFRVAFKPTSSISKPQRTWDFSAAKYREFSVGGRHDTCFALRTPPVVEALAAIVIYNLM